MERVLRSILVEGRGSGGKEFASVLDHTVGQGETKLGHKDLLDVRATDIGHLLDLGNPEDLSLIKHCSKGWSLSAVCIYTALMPHTEMRLTWIERNRAR
jgi:hypothetical protein